MIMTADFCRFHGGVSPVFTTATVLYKKKSAEYIRQQVMAEKRKKDRRTRASEMKGEREWAFL